MTFERTDEQLLREWMSETVWLPDSDLSGVQTRIHRTPQHRGLLPPLDPGGIVRMFSATRFLVAGIVLALFGSFAITGLLPKAEGPELAPAIAAPSVAPEETSLAVSVPTADAGPDVYEAPRPIPDDGSPRLVIEMHPIALLKGQTMTARAKWCRTVDDCRPAEGVRWSTTTPDIVKVHVPQGPSTRVTALAPGSADLSARGWRSSYGIGFEVRPRPGRVTDHEEYWPMRWHLTTPREQVLKLGQYVVLTGWICPTKDMNRLGRDGKPGTDDDRCSTDDVRDVWLLPNAGLALVGTAGPSAVLVADSYELDEDTVMSSWTGLKFDFKKGWDFGISNLYVRDGAWRGPLLGDLNEDGLVDPADVAILTDAREADGPQIRRDAVGWRKLLDLNVDYVIDDTDAEIIRLLAAAHAGDLVPTKSEPRIDPRLRERSEAAASAAPPSEPAE